MHSEVTQMCGCRTAGRTLRSRKEKEVPPDSKTAEQDGVALRNSAWGRQTGWGPFLIAFHGPSFSCFSAVSCDLEVSERTNLKVDKVLSFLPAEGEGNYDLSSPLPQPCLFSGQQGTTISLVPHPPILFLIFTCTQMRLLCFSKTVRETKNEGELGSWEERGSLHGEQRETEYAKGRLGHWGRYARWCY